MAALATPTALAAQQLKHGDVNGDGVVSALDAQAILTAVVGLSLPPGYVVANGDANCDNTTVALDAQLVLSYVIGLSTSQYCVGASFGPGAITMSLRAGTATVPDTSLLINRGIWLRAVLTDAGGFNVQRPIAWTNATPEFVSIDTMRNDSAFVKATATAGTASVSASADGVTRTMPIRVRTSYAGIVIQPQRGDTIRQLNGTRSFTARSRDSVGTLSGFPTAFWTTGDASIATVPATASNSATVTAISTGTTWVYATLSTNPAVKDSVPLTVALPPVNSCVANTGTLHTNATYTTPQTWTAATNPHHVTGSLQFNSGSRLTIEPGVLVCMTGSSYMYFNDGTRITAIGTVTNPITFTTANVNDLWAQIQLGNNSGARTDTSTFKNVVMERPYYGVLGYNDHVVLMDSVRIRDFGYYGMQLYAIGSKVSRTTIDTSRTGYSGYGAYLGPVTIEESTIRLTTGSGTGLYLFDSTTVRQVSISGGTTAIDAGGSTNNFHLNNVTISGTTEVALDLPYDAHPSSANVQISGGTGGAFRGSIGTFGILFPDSLKQETLKNNGKDTVFITGGSLRGATVVVRPDVPWVVQSYAYVDTLAQVAPRPGSTIAFTFGALIFRAGGTLNAVGESNKFIRFVPLASGQFYGLQFDAPGQGSGGTGTWPYATSTMTYVRVDSATGLGVNTTSMCCYSAAINGATRHRLLLDSVIVHKAMNTAIAMAASGSYLKRSLIDTTGNVGSNYTTSQAALVVGDSQTVENTLVRRSGQVGLYAPRYRTLLTNVRVVASQNAALYFDGGPLDPASTGVRADSANAYPFYGRIENFGIIAGTAALQTANLLGNTDNVAVIYGGNLTNKTVEVIPALRWQVSQSPNVDTLAVLQPQPGADITFTDGILHFTRGGTLNAVGTTTNFIRFRPVAGYNWSGLRFDEPGPGAGGAGTWPYATSTMTYVRVDSAAGTSLNNYTTCCFSAAIAGALRHRLLLDSVIVHKAHNNAIWMNASGSYLKRSLIDTTGNIGSNYTTTHPALALGDSVTVENTLVRRSGYTGIYANQDFALFTNVRVVASLNVALQFDGGRINPASTNVRADSANAYPFYGRIENLGTIANTAALQTSNLLGNADNVAVIVGGTLTNRTLDVIPALRWQVTQSPNIDTLGVLQPQPGADIRFYDGILHFTRGGTLNAVGTSTNFIRFRPVAGSNWSGLRFDEPGAGAGGAGTWPYATSTLTYVQVDSAAGTSLNNYSTCCFSAAIAGALRHRLLLDSVIVRKAQNNAIWMNASGSYIKRTLIDTTGNIGSNYTTTQAAIALGDSITVENTLVRRSGYTGIYANQDFALFTNVRVVASQNVALQLDGGTINPTSTGVRADSANAYPFYGRIQNFGIIANTAALQTTNLLGNTDNVAVIVGGALTNQTVEVIPALRWQVTQSPNVDTLAVLQPQPGADITFTDGILHFSRGGILNAVGTTTNFIRFRPATPSNQWAGLRFDEPGAGVSGPFAQSTLTYVRVDSAAGTSLNNYKVCCYSAAISGAIRHRLLLDSVIVHKAYNNAVWMNASGSIMQRSVIDTTGNVGSGYQTSQPAVVIADSITLQNSVIRRSGYRGLLLYGRDITMSAVRVVNSRTDGVELALANVTYRGSVGVSGANAIIADSSGGVGFLISGGNNIILTHCFATRGLTASSHGVVMAGNYSGVQVHNCDLLDNGGNGVNNTFSNTIDASNNWWGNASDPNLTGGDGVAGNVTTTPLCTSSCTNIPFLGVQPIPGTPAIPARSNNSRAVLRARRRRLRTR